MLIQPEVDISKANGDIYQIVELCATALLKIGEQVNQLEDYQKAVQSMKNKVSESKAYIRTLAILAEYCRIL